MYSLGSNCRFELWLYILLVFVLIYFLSLSNWFKRIHLALTLPGPRAFPIIGNSLIVTNNEALTNLGRKSYEKYGPIVRGWLSFLPIFVIFEPKDIQAVLNTHKNVEKTFFYTLMHNFLGNGLITSTGDRWKVHRKLLQPSFTANVLDTFIDTFSDSSISLIKKLEIVSRNSECINVTSFINSAVLDVLNEAVLGIPIKQHMSKTYDSPFRKGKVVTQDRIAKPWLLFDFIYQFTNDAKNENNQNQNLNTYTSKVIKIRKDERRRGIYKKDRTNLLDRMLDISEEQPEFTDDDILNEVCTFMLAGQESVASNVAFCLYYLAKQKNIQDKVYEELKSIFDKTDRMPNSNDLHEMIYLEKCIKETLRLSPSVPILARKLGESITVELQLFLNPTDSSYRSIDWLRIAPLVGPIQQIFGSINGKYNLPVGSDVYVSPYATHRLAHIYTNPDIFDPERFSPEEIEKRHPYSFIPFSAGPRNCIGYKFAQLEIKTIISTIIRHFEISVKPGYTLIHGFRITLRAKGGIWLQLKPRKT